MHSVEEQVFAAVTVDIIGSTTVYENTGRSVRERLLAVLDAVNSRFGSELAVPFGITIGDEFQGLMRNMTSVPWAIYRIRAELIPLHCRIGVGIGPVASSLLPYTRDMEGPAFTMSREALDEAGGSRLTVYRMDDAVLQEAVNTIAMLTDAIRSDWTEKQWQAVRAYLEHGSWTCAAQALGITKQAVARRIRSLHWQEVHEATSSLETLLARLSG